VCCGGPWLFWPLAITSTACTVALQTVHVVLLVHSCILYLAACPGIDDFAAAQQDFLCALARYRTVSGRLAVWSTKDGSMFLLSVGASLAISHSAPCLCKSPGRAVWVQLHIVVQGACAHAVRWFCPLGCADQLMAFCTRPPVLSEACEFAQTRCPTSLMTGVKVSLRHWVVLMMCA